MTWSHGRRLSTLQQGELSVSYQYGIDGLRSRKTVNGVEHKYQYHGDQLIYEEYGGKKFYFFYDPEGRPTRIRYQLSSGGTFQDVYYVTNWRGDVTALYDTTGTRIASYDYDAWGNLVSIQDADGQNISDQNHIAVLNPLRYRGYYYDAESGFYYVSSRYYDPEVRRWINSDDPEIIDGSNDHALENNLFAYCFNNPANMIDTSGHWPEWATNLVKVGIGALAIGIGVAATVATGGAAAPVLVASLKVAATSAAIGAAVGAGSNAVNHRISTGSWSGAGRAALSGAVDGAADGFMWGGISAGATFTTVAAKGVKAQQIGRLKPTNKPGKGYPGVKYKNRRGSLKSFELHSPHKGGPHQKWHWQRNTWNPKTGSITGRPSHWTMLTWRKF